MIDQHPEEIVFEGPEEPGPPPSTWRRPFSMAVAALTALAIAVLPLYNLIAARQFAENGLEVCGFDYCVVQEAVRAAGLDRAMGRLATRFLDEAGAAEMAEMLGDHLDIDPVRVEVVQELDGRLGGLYEPESRLVTIESPARAWTVLHEVAHAVAGDHGQEFQETVIDLVTWLDESQG